MAERISDPMGSVATATLLLIAAGKDPGIRNWVEEVWLTAPAEERDEDGKPLQYMEKLLKLNKPYYRIGEKPNIVQTYEVVNCAANRMVMTLNVLTDQLKDAIKMG